MSSDYSLFVYGSLMSREELDNMFSSYSIKTVRLNGFVRDYSEGAVVSWGDDGKVTGVLGIHPKQDEWCNGLLVTGVSEREFKDYVDREYGYRIETVPVDKFEAYEGDLNVSGSVFTAVRGWVIEDPYITESYRELCHSAASDFGEEFLEDFTESTYDFYPDQGYYTVSLRAGSGESEFVFDVGSVGDVRSIFLEVEEYTDLLYRKGDSEWGSGELVFERV